MLIITCPNCEASVDIDKHDECPQPDCDTDFTEYDTLCSNGP